MKKKSHWVGAMLALPLVGAAVTSCEALGPLGGPLEAAACPELRGGAMGASFTADAKANGTIRAFVQASSDLRDVSAAMEAQVADACMRMGLDLGIPPAQMAPQQGAGGRAQGACAPVSARIDQILRAAGNATLAVSYTPPECRFAADAYAQCAAQCNVSVDPGQIVARCQPGQLSGYCQGTCTGSCDGVCNGNCQGTCSSRNAQGQCAGNCNGTCQGQCSATCHAQCQGQWQAPRCNVDARAPSADAKCDASCKAHAEITATCSPARVAVQATAQAQYLAALVATLQANMPALITAEIGYGKRLAADIDALVTVAGGLSQVIGDAGAHAMACVGAAGSEIVQAQASIRVSVSVSASVTGRVGAT
ncbi:MAG TPA: hypothetical protein VIF15_20690 [Polyangiaceae bacterium]|jgi:hypothetical protein